MSIRNTSSPDIKTTLRNLDDSATENIFESVLLRDLKVSYRIYDESKVLLQALTAELEKAEEGLNTRNIIDNPSDKLLLREFLKKSIDRVIDRMSREDIIITERESNVFIKMLYKRASIGSIGWHKGWK